MAGNVVKRLSMQIEVGDSQKINMEACIDGYKLLFSGASSGPLAESDVVDLAESILEFVNMTSKRAG